MRKRRRSQSGISAGGEIVSARPRRRRQAHEGGQRDDADGHRERGVGRGQGRLDERRGQGRRERDDPERDEDRVAIPETPPGEEARHRGDQDRRDDDQGVEDRLVVRAEEVDEDLLRARRLEADDERPHRDDERGRARDQSGEQLGARDRERRRRPPRRGPARPAARAGRVGVDAGGRVGSSGGGRSIERAMAGTLAGPCDGSMSARHPAVTDDRQAAPPKPARYMRRQRCPVPAARPPRSAASSWRRSWSPPPAPQPGARRPRLPSRRMMEHSPSPEAAR